MFYNDVGDDETSQSMRTGLIVVQSSHAPGLKAIFEKYDRGVDDDDDKFCDDDDSFLLYCKFCCMTTKYVGIAYKFCISIDHLMFYVQNKLVRKKVFFILSCFYRTIVLKPKKKKEKVADLNLDVPTFQSLIATFHSNTWAIASNWFRFAECCLMQSFHSNNIFSIVTLPFEQSTSFAITFSFGSTYFPPHTELTRLGPFMGGGCLGSFLPEMLKCHIFCSFKLDTKPHFIEAC